MKKVLVLIGSILLSYNFSYAYARGKDCKLVDLEATLSTTNISTNLQVGSMDLRVSRVKGQHSKTLFDQIGGVIGRTVFSDTEAGFYLFNHRVVFEKGSSLQTESDQAQVVGLCDDGRFKVFESLNTIAWGNKFFRRAYIPEDQGLLAEGCVDPSLGGANDFSITGKICLK